MVYYNIIRGEEKRIPYSPPPPSPTFFGCLNYYFIIKLLNYNGQGQVQPLSCRQGTPQVGSATKRNKIRNLKTQKLSTYTYFWEFLIYLFLFRRLDQASMYPLGTTSSFLPKKSATTGSCRSRTWPLSTSTHLPSRMDEM